MKPLLLFLAVVYTCSRIVINIVQFYFILYVTDTLYFSKESIAYFPLILLITELFANTLIKNVRKILGNKWTFCVAALVVLQSCIWFQLQSQTAGKNFVFLSAIMMCSGSSVMLTTSLSMLTDLANKDKGSSEFIYSALGFLEKLFVGIIIIVIQSNYPCANNGGKCPECADYVRLFFTLTPAIVTIVALIMILFGFKTTVMISCINTGIVLIILGKVRQ
ncbi:Major facilitator superfamily domain-containing protein 12 [Exaiptasia diaphana]|nr:Major facilitator superfamily domain-containing protein 12 [Exaiptasia diaphana]